jgi:hypothetical protein
LNLMLDFERANAPERCVRHVKRQAQQDAHVHTSTM